MTNLKEIEEAVSNLKEKEFTEFREWFEKFDALVWDKQFNEDVKSGKLDKVAKRAIDEYNKKKM